MLLWLIVPLAVILIMGLTSIRDQVKWKKSIAAHLQPYVIQKGSEGIRMWMMISFFAVLLISILGVSGPTWNQIQVEGETLETPVIIVLDLSQSMMATDIQPNRLERAKFKISDFLDANPMARVALIGYAGTAHTIVPLTKDYNIIKSHLSGLTPNVMPFPGSDLESALQLAKSVSSITDAPANIMLLSDDYDDFSFESIQEFARQGNHKFTIVPFNTATGADIPAIESSNSLRNAQGEVLHSALNTTSIQKINSINNVDVQSLTLDKSDMELIAKRIKSSLEFQTQDEEKQDQWLDRGFWLVIPFALFILMWFRKGFVLYSIPFLLLFSSCVSDSSYTNLWLTNDYQAQKLYNDGEYSAAATQFTSALYQGVAYYKAGNYDDAIRALKADSSAMSAYNLGLAYYKNGDILSAQAALNRAIEKDPSLEVAKTTKLKVQNIISAMDQADLEAAKEFQAKEQAENEQNSGPEDLSGGGQEATEEDMEEERKEETASTDIRKGKELDEVPDDIEFGKQEEGQKILMRKVDDDPALFLKRKFAHQVKEQGLKSKNPHIIW
jgi:Ca-activated chloride channel homolog